MIRYGIIFFLLFISGPGLFAQVEHNYLVGPQYTTCDSLPAQFNNLAEEIYAVQQAKFRFTQQVRISRISGIRSAEFYSCDNQSGYLVLQYPDSTCLFQRVDIRLWHEFVKNTEFENYINRNIRTRYKQVCGPAR